jgi:hypothetical protein
MPTSDPIPCRSGKLQYDTSAEAVAVMVRLKRKGRTSLAHFQCQHCGFWHLGNRRKIGRELKAGRPMKSVMP